MTDVISNGSRIRIIKGDERPFVVVHLVRGGGDVNEELDAVGRPVATHVTRERSVEAVVAHVQRVCDAVTEPNTTVPAFHEPSPVRQRRQRP